MGCKGFNHHDHTGCVLTAIDALQAYCVEHKLKLTPLRLRVFEILLEENRAVGAYEILDKLKADGFSAQPPIAYRALDFLVNAGFAHKISHLNSFTACGHPGTAHLPAFLICRSCKAVQETDHLPSQSWLEGEAKSADFALENSFLEAVGLCPNCHEAPSK